MCSNKGQVLMDVGGGRPTAKSTQGTPYQHQHQPCKWYIVTSWRGAPHMDGRISMVHATPGIFLKPLLISVMSRFTYSTLQRSDPAYEAVSNRYTYTHPQIQVALHKQPDAFQPAGSIPIPRIPRA